MLISFFSLQPLPASPLFSGRANQQQTLPQDGASAELHHAFRIRRETALTSRFPHPPATSALSVTSFRIRDSVQATGKRLDWRRILCVVCESCRCNVWGMKQTYLQCERPVFGIGLPCARSTRARSCFLLPLFVPVPFG